MSQEEFVQAKPAVFGGFGVALLGAEKLLLPATFIGVDMWRWAMMQRPYALRVCQLAMLACTLTQCALLSGCFGATRLPTRSKGPLGEEKRIDLTFLQAGVTRREDVVQKLDWLNVGYSHPRLFWGRWLSSSWGWWFVVCCAAEGGAGTGGRLWGPKNLLIEFDEAGIVKWHGLVEDEKLVPELHARLAQEPPLDLSHPIRIELEHWHRGHRDYRFAEMRLGTQELAFHEDGLHGHAFQITPDKVRRIGPAGRGRGEGGITFVLFLSEKTSAGRTLAFRADASSLIILLRYLNQMGSTMMQWG